MSKLLRIVTIALILLLLTSSMAFAAIAAPDTRTVNTISAYQNTVETNDQLYIATFEISYTVNPDDNASINYLFRLFDSGVEIATTTPYAYYDSGYDQGVISFYFPADDADLPAWGTAILSLELTGNPALDWGGDPPSDTNNVIDSWNTQRILVGARVRAIAIQLENVWTGADDLLAPEQGVNKLTSAGENYFETVIPNLRTISPELFTSATSAPDFPDEDHDTTYGNTVEDRWLTSGNGTFDMTDTATLFNTSRNWMTSMLYVGLCVGILFVASYKINQGKSNSGFTGTGLRPALFLFGALMVMGSFMGFMVFEAGLFCGIAGGLALVFAIFWKGSV